jgi:hypothetical protein
MITFTLPRGYKVTATRQPDRRSVTFETTNPEGEVISIVTRKGADASRLLVALHSGRVAYGKA